MDVSRVTRFIIDNSTLAGTDTPVAGQGRARHITIGPGWANAAQKVWGDAAGRAKLHDVLGLLNTVELAMRGGVISDFLGSASTPQQALDAALARFSIIDSELSRWMSLAGSSAGTTSAASYRIINEPAPELRAASGSTQTFSFSRAEVDMARALSGGRPDKLLTEIAEWRAAGNKLHIGHWRNDD